MSSTLINYELLSGYVGEVVMWVCVIIGACTIGAKLLFGRKHDEE